MTGISPLAIALFFAAGAALGAVYFLLLAWTVDLLGGQGGAMRVVPLYLLRLALAIGAFWAIAQQGALPLLISLLGFLAARFAVQRRYGSSR